MEYFPLQQMYFVNGDEFIRNPVPEIKAVQKFLGLPVLIDSRSFFFNETKVRVGVRRRVIVRE